MTVRMLLSGLWLAVVVLAGPARGEAASGLEPLQIVSASGTHQWSVEVMRTDAERERGLMFRRHMPGDRGMLFDFGKAAPVMMWMENTYLPLDMVFIAADGRVLSVAENAEPLSRRVIPSGGAALGVLEVNAGSVARYGIRPGDKVVNPMFPH